jgi:small conductance mechanosensitive channel
MLAPPPLRRFTCSHHEGNPHGHAIDADHSEHDVDRLGGNSKVFSDTVMNFSARPVRRVERVAQLAGSVGALDAIERLKAAPTKVPNVTTTPAPAVNLLDIYLVGTVIAVRPYCRTDHYCQVCFDSNEAIVRTAKEAGWPAPTPTQII